MSLALKVQARLFRNCADLDGGRKFLMVWIKGAMRSGTKPFSKMAEIPAGYKARVLGIIRPGASCFQFFDAY